MSDSKTCHKNFRGSTVLLPCYGQTPKLTLHKLRNRHHDSRQYHFSLNTSSWEGCDTFLPTALLYLSTCPRSKIKLFVIRVVLNEFFFNKFKGPGGRFGSTYEKSVSVLSTLEESKDGRDSREAQRLNRRCSSIVEEKSVRSILTDLVLAEVQTLYNL